MDALKDSIDRLYDLTKQRLAAQKAVDALKTIEDELKASLIAYAKEVGEDSLAGSVATLNLKYSEKPEVTDWSALQAHIRATGELDLLEKRPMASAIKVRWEEGNEVPGVARVEAVTATLKAVKA